MTDAEKLTVMRLLVALEEWSQPVQHIVPLSPDGSWDKVLGPGATIRGKRFAALNSALEDCWALVR